MNKTTWTRGVRAFWKSSSDTTSFIYSTGPRGSSAVRKLYCILRWLNPERSALLSYMEFFCMHLLSKRGMQRGACRYIWVSERRTFVVSSFSFWSVSTVGLVSVLAVFSVVPQFCWNFGFTLITLMLTKTDRICHFFLDLVFEYVGYCRIISLKIKFLREQVFMESLFAGKNFRLNFLLKCG